MLKIYYSVVDREENLLRQRILILENIMANKSRETAALIFELEFEDCAVFLETTEFVFPVKMGEYGRAQIEKSPRRVTGQRPDKLRGFLKNTKTGARI